MAAAPRPIPRIDIAETWATEFQKPDLRQINANVVWGQSRDDEPGVCLVSRSGFEQRYIQTSMIASQ